MRREEDMAQTEAKQLVPLVELDTYYILLSGWLSKAQVEKSLPKRSKFLNPRSWGFPPQPVLGNRSEVR